MGEHEQRRRGRFALRAFVDEGGFGRVYLGVDARGTRAAVKVLHRELLRDTDVRARERFVREIEFLQRVGQVGAVPRLIEADSDDDPPWLATEFVDGLPLGRVLRRGAPLSPALVIRLTAVIARTLVSLHEHGAHRDLKPGNVLVTLDGPQLVDFGLARGPADHPLTRAGRLAGTPAFMAPERITPWPNPDADPAAADVFELAGTMVFAATGHGPYPEMSFPDDAFPARPGPDDVTDLFDVDDDLHALLEAALAFDPTDRPTAGELAERASRLDSTPAFEALLPREVASDLEELVRARTPIIDVTTDPVRSPAQGPRGTRVAVAGPTRAPMADGSPEPGGTPASALWVRRLGAPIAALAAAPGDGIVVVTRAGDVHVLDLEGRPRWSRRLPSTPTGAIATLGGHVLLGTDSGQVHVLDPRGTLIDHPWVGGAVRALVTCGDRVLAAGAAGVVCALMDRRRGVVDERALGAAVHVPIVVHEDVALIATEDGVLHALAVDSLTPLWSRALKEHVLSLRTVDEVVVITTSAGDVRGLSRTGGSTLWTRPLDGQAWALEVAPGRHAAVAVTVEGTASVVSLIDGERVRSVDLGAPVRRAIAPGRPGEVVIGALDGSFRILGVDGEGPGPFAVPGAEDGSVEIAPAVVSDVHVIGRADGTLSAVSLATRRAA